MKAPCVLVIHLHQLFCRVECHQGNTVLRGVLQVGSALHCVGVHDAIGCYAHVEHCLQLSLETKIYVYITDIVRCLEHVYDCCVQRRIATMQQTWSRSSNKLLHESELHIQHSLSRAILLVGCLSTDQQGWRRRKDRCCHSVPTRGTRAT